ADDDPRRKTEARTLPHDVEGDRNADGVTTCGQKPDQWIEPDAEISAERDGAIEKPGQPTNPGEARVGEGLWGIAHRSGIHLASAVPPDAGRRHVLAAGRL